MYEIGSNNGLCRSIRQNHIPLINNRQSLLSFLGGNINSIRLNSLDIPRIIIDGNQLIYPLISNQDNTNFKDPQWKNLLGINYFSQGLIPLRNKNHLILNIMQIQKGILIPHILRYDIDKIRLILNDIEINKKYDLLKLILNERLDGYRNIFHACIHISIPLTNKEYIINDERISFPIDLLQSQTNIDHNYEQWPSSNESTDAQPPSSPTTTNFSRSLSTGTTSKIHTSTRSNSNHFSVWSSCKYDEREKRIRSIKILRLLLDYPLFQEHLYSLLSFRNFEGQTPFMSAINFRAYHSALILYEYALKISNKNELLLQIIYPLTSMNSNSSPLFTLCTNDTCSFTWTGEEHISQTIFECKTCGLSGTLCCCSECAQTCHKGHDCRLKQTSPTAYCDCWEICKCKSLIAGDQQKRFELFKLLLNQTNLVEIKNFYDENILLYLVKTVGRQLIEQQQFARTSTAAILQQQARKTREQLITVTGITKKLINTMDLESNIPDHHLEPPQFCRRALELILTDWSAVKSMLLCGCPDDFNPTIIKTKEFSSMSSPLISIYNNENIFSIDEQQQTSQLDRFTYFLLVKCNTIKQTNDFLDILLNTLIREMSNSIHRDIARYVTARFVRSVIRLFIILNLQLTPEKNSKRFTTINSSTLTGPQLILFQCKRIFQTLTIISIDALVHMADLLLAPVRHGIAKPIAMFNLLSTHTDILQSLDEIFNINSEYSRINQRNETDMELIEDDDNNSDIQSQHDINEHQTTTTTIRENLTTNLSDNESEIELELLAESDTDNESNHSTQNTNTHRTSATAGSENMALFSDDENSESDDGDSVRSKSTGTNDI
jgi:E3 ubiquitin-protein ligase EDD1